MKSRMFRVTALFMARFFVLLALTGVIPRPASAQPGTPTNLRVDISDGNSGQLFVSWDKSTSGATYYDLQRSLSQNSGYQHVANCYGSSDAGYNDTPFASEDTPFQTEVCHDSGLAVTNPPTYYYYEVAACNISNQCSLYTSTTPAVLNGTYNSPVSCNCSLPPMVFNGQNLKIPSPNPIRLVTSTVTPDAQYHPSDPVQAGYYNPGPPGYSITPKHVLLVQLPGSRGYCTYSPLMYTAQNLGFDAICVNYSNYTQQETICSGNPDCFYYITEAKFDGTGPCTHWRGPWYVNCGFDPYTNTQYYNYTYDAVQHRVTTMLQYLCNNYDTANTQWEYYLTGYPNAGCNGSAPDWTKIIMAGFSQGGDMATYTAGLEDANRTPIVRAINLSAPPQATQVGTTWTAATYFTSPSPWFSSTTIRYVFGLVSANDSHYTPPGTPGVFQAVWAAMGFTAANNDAEWDLNCNVNQSAPCYSQNPQGLSCSGTPSNNLVNFAKVNPGGTGHDDPNYIWNQDMFEFMLLDN
jgi:hypothetical protein